MATKFQRFTVKGSGTFPFDMLRYDQCFPSKSEDAIWITNHGERELMLTTISGPPTVKRWSSFGWEVTEIFTERG